ncbi:helix-turn-helix transcriptional regulator [Rhodococcus ruber]
MTTNDDSRWLSTDDACRYIGVSRWTLDRLAKDGYLPVRHLPGGSTKRYARADLDALFATEDTNA